MQASAVANRSFVERVFLLQSWWAVWQPGMSFDEVAHEYDLRDEDIRAALGYASARVGEESLHPLPARAA
jgi:hypothetical protein